MSLETLQFGPDTTFANNSNNFEGGIPAEWGSLTNLKKLNVVKCGLDGKIGSTRTERFNLAMHINECRLCCTVTKDEKTALKSKLPGCTILF